jgi:glycosyltransferase involved in cell wall biosynthesis
MKVVHVIDRLAIGGAEKALIYATKAIADRNIHTGILLFNSGYQLEKDIDTKVILHVLNRTNKYKPATLLKAHNICKGYDIVHAHLRHVYAYIRLAQIMFGGKYKLILHDHAAITLETPLKLKGLFKPVYYIGVNTEQTYWAQRVLHVKKENIFLHENAVEESRHLYTQSKSNKALLVGNIRSVKNIEFGIELVKGMNWALDIYGNVIEEDYRDKLLSLIGQYNIRIIEGVTDIDSRYSDYSIAIHCSPKETGPLVLLEYLSAGIPFISYKTGSAAEAIYQYLPELFMDNFEPHKWEQRINEILSDISLPVKMRMIFKNHFNTGNYVHKCLNIYKSVHS